MRKKYIIIIFICWFFWLMYPNPLHMGRSLYRIFYPPIDPGRVASLLIQMPEDPSLIETYVLSLVPYSYDWQTYQVPWYFPSVEEVLTMEQGDCKSRFVMLASLLTASNIEFQHRLSPTHIWVDYPGKTPTPLENPAVTFFADDGEERAWQVPQYCIQDFYATTKTAYWDAMPPIRKANLFMGLIATSFIWLQETKYSKKSNGTLKNTN